MINKQKNKIESLTTEQESQMYFFREEWRRKALSTERIDKDATKEEISKMYKLIGKEPPVFIFVPSLMFAQFQISFCREVLPLVFDKRDNLRDNLGANLWDNLRDNLGANLWDNLRDNLRDNLWANLWANLRDNLGANLWANLRANLGANLRDNLRANLKYEPTYLNGNMDAFWIAFYEYPEKFLGVQYKVSDSEKLAIWSTLAKSCCWFWCYENYCFVSDRPTSYHWDDDKRLHNTSGPAITWIDGWELHYIHGRTVEKSIFDKCLSGSVTKNDFIKESNEEVKAAMYEILGQEKIVALLGAKEIGSHTFMHANGDKEIVTLLKTDEVFEEADNNPLAWCRFVCPSTGTNYLIDVEPHHTNAKDAAISTSPLFFTEEEYSFTKRS